MLQFWDIFMLPSDFLVSFFYRYHLTIRAKYAIIFSVRENQSIMEDNTGSNRFIQKMRCI